MFKTKLVCAVVGAAFLAGCTPMQQRQVADATKILGVVAGAVAAVSKVGQAANSGAGGPAGRVGLDGQGGLPVAAFQGGAVVGRVADLAATRGLAVDLARAARLSMQAGDAELAALQLWWARRFAEQSATMAAGSSAAVRAAAGGRIPVAPGATIVVPVYTVGGADSGRQFPKFSAADFDEAPKMALLEGLGGLGGLPSRGERPLLVGETRRIGELLVQRSGDSLVVHNPSGEVDTLPFEDLGLLPLPPELSEARKAAAPYFKKIASTVSASVSRWPDVYLVVSAPGQILDAKAGRRLAWLGPSGIVNSQSSDYSRNPQFKTAIDTLAEADKKTLAFDFECRRISPSTSSLSFAVGKHGEVYEKTCGNLWTKQYWMGDSIVQTASSMLADRRVQKAMDEALNQGKLASDLMGALGVPVVGNLESGMQCFGRDTFSQLAAVEAAKRAGKLGMGEESARLAGWKPKEESGPAAVLDQVANCLGMVPLVGSAVSGGLKGAARVGKTIEFANPDRLMAAFKIFDSPRSAGSFKAGLEAIGDLFPHNQRAAKFAKSIYDGILTGNSAVQIKADLGV